MSETLQSAIQQSVPYPLAFASITGSHAFGMAGDYSDYDCHGMYVLPLREVIGLKDRREVIEAKTEHPENGLEVDVHMYDISHAVRYLLKGNGNFLEDVFSPLVVASSPLHEELQDLTNKHCLSRMSAAHYKGMSFAQQRKMKHNEIKKLLHQYRCLLTGLNFIRTGHLIIDIVTLAALYKQPQVRDLIEVKLSPTSTSTLASDVIEMHNQHTEALVAQLDEAWADSPLPICPSEGDVQAMEDFLYRVRLDHTHQCTDCHISLRPSEPRIVHGRGICWECYIQHMDICPSCKADYDANAARFFSFIDSLETGEPDA